MTSAGDNSRADVLLVGYERQENLGLRSIMAYLQAHGHRAVLVPFFPGDEGAVLAAVRQHRPRLVGFSLIFQFTLDEFGRLMRQLRADGVTAHFTAGGHFPSLRPQSTFELIPELDSIVRFEGEVTLLELLENLEHTEQWKNIPGLAFRYGTETIISSPRPLIADLDTLPPVFRDEPQQMGGVNIAAMLASRGCLFNCSFCSIRQFYGAPEGRLRRVRSPQAVVAEMRALYREKDVRFFSFQDDDFAARSSAQRTWLDSFLDELGRSSLADKIAWKISCRVDDLDAQRLERMQAHGLIAVYLGVESGNDLGLRALNKHASVAQNLAAVELLKRHNVALSIGFMLFDPSSTLATVRQNIRFLRTVGEDGYFPINFCKMLPYAGTPIEASLRAEGRLTGTVTQPDYGFSDAVLDWYEFLVQQAFSRRNFAPSGLVALLQQIDFDWRLATRFSSTPASPRFGLALNRIIRDTNLLAVESLEALLEAVVSRGIDFLLEDKDQLIEMFEREWRGEMKAEVKLNELCMWGGIAADDSSASLVSCPAQTRWPAAEMAQCGRSTSVGR